MTKQKAFKRRVRARMAKTGESYSSARRMLLPTPPRPVSIAPAAEPRYPDSTVRAATGHDWGAWFAILDEWGAADRTHAEIARWLVAERNVGGWWAQGIAGVYEQARGLRVPGQLSAGMFGASASKTINVAPERVTEAFVDGAVRDQWMRPAPLRIRTSRPGKSVTADWGDEPSRVSVYLTATDTGGAWKTRVSLSHERLADGSAVAEFKAYWRATLTDLKTLLEG